MADYHKLTDTLLFESQSPSGSRLNEDGYGELQNTSVFDDTIVLDSPLNENQTQLENVCFDTEVVDDDDLGNMEDVKAGQLLCEFDMEVVLDSEDEGVRKTKSESFVDGKITGRLEEKEVDLPKRERQTQSLDADAVDKQFGAGKKGFSVNTDRSHGKKDVTRLSVCDHETGRLEYVCSQEPEESSQANALCFVDNFLTFNDADMCQRVEERTGARKKSPLVSTAKGTQRLARIINRGSPVKEMVTFEWFESDQHGETDSFSRRMTASSEFGDFRQRTDKRHQNLHSKKERGLSNDHEEKKESVNLDKDIRCPSHSHSSFMEQGSKVSTKIEQESERNLINGSVKELDNLMRKESPWEKVEASGTAGDIPDMFDVGIGTQIAAEAMEALFYGPPIGCKAGDICEGPEDFHTDFPEDKTKSRTDLEQHSLQKPAASELGDKAKQSIRRKRSTRRYSKEVFNSSWNCNYQVLHHTIKPKPCKSKQSEAHAVSSNNLKKCVSCVSPSIPDEQTLFRKQLSRKEPVIDQTRHWDGASMKGTKDQPAKHRVMTNNVKEGRMLIYKRKRKRVVADPPKLLNGKQKCSTLHSNTSAQALDGKLSEQEKISTQEAAIARFLRLIPKGKRTRRKVPVHYGGASNMLASLTSVGTEEHNLHSVRSQKMPEDDETTFNNFNMKGKKCSAISLLSLEHNSDESLSRRNCNEQIAGIVTNSDSAVTSTRISASNLDRSKTVQTGKLDYMDSTLVINGSENYSFGILQKKSVESSGTECNTRVSCRESVNETSFNNMPYVYHRRHCNKNLPKPSILKELNGLGVPDSISDFTRKGFRTRREVAFVRVLFSQHLGDDIIKQQKKISARLGISITSCSMDATHFIADEFVRTKNMLEAIALGKPVVTHLWLDSCGQASCLLDEKNYMLRDSKKEKEIGFSMPVSLARARQYPLLKGRRVCITQNVKPNKEMITSLVRAVGGEVVGTSQKLAAKDQKIPDDLLILSCEEDLAICGPLLDKAVYSSELLLSGIVIQKLEYERHQLLVKFVKEKRKISEGNRHSRRLSKR
ncbi:PREDICTED: uncharacterized protein LOC18613460 isoform X2 [Theobroma cacao]|uniref:Uncharacterized protein LOC18613460 isoform X2 n=1 Tax=Theobroma cacao TaxID=3641 RepID=A0AB32VPT3_THECC|nr:PREDICTED: uncharacterized protein LOC18613460 isoform X2 [Theobroma cacao]